MRENMFVACLVALLAPVGVVLGVNGALADEPTRTIVIKDHRFDPAVVEVPVGVRIKLVVENRDATAEEFESLDLRREKVVPGNTTVTIWVGPLSAGEYRFAGEFHEDTAQGKLIAK